MSKVLILGGGFGGVIAAETLGKKLGDKHEITLVSRSRKFVFYPALVRLAFGQCTAEEITFDLRESMRERHVQFVEGEVARINLREHHVTFSHGDLTGEMPYDYLVVALGRRLATERVTGFFEHAYHLLGITSARKFGQALENFHSGRVVLGHCASARLPVPLFESAFALSRLLKERGDRGRCQITIAANQTPDEMFGDTKISEVLNPALESHGIELVSGFVINEVTSKSVIATDGRELDCDLRMLIPPFRGPGASLGLGITDEEDYLRVDRHLRVPQVEHIYAVGDCASFFGPKFGDMAVHQAEVAAHNLAQEISGEAPSLVYDHEMMAVVDSGVDSIFVHKDLWTEERADVQRSRFWGWAKQKQERYWKATHA
ncbi:MAG TPA: FAD-dependent oxidoreductase [Pyrinomonadaceae bacterium]|nr:FAD-dependent oxidoreductase [Pyrinomonadaceae bacterium]